MSQFESMMKNSSKNFDQLTKKLDNDSKSKSHKDERYWQPKVDDNGNGFAVIRFLPPSVGEDIPFVKMWSHFFKGPAGQYYINNSLTTIGKDDPVSEMNNQLWNTGTDENKKIVRERKRHLHYHANIYVVADSNQPETVGKVYLFKFGQKIFDKIKDKLNPQFEDEPKVNVFDYLNGADFKLKIRKVEGYRNYDKSEFASPAPLLDGDMEKLEVVWGNQYSLSEIVADDKFKSYDQLKTQLDRVVGNSTPTNSGPVRTAEQEIAADDSTPFEVDNSSTDNSGPTVNASDVDDDLAFFNQMALGD